MDEEGNLDKTKTYFNEENTINYITDTPKETVMRNIKKTIKVEERTKIKEDPKKNDVLCDIPQSKTEDEKVKNSQLNEPSNKPVTIKDGDDLP